MKKTIALILTLLLALAMGAVVQAAPADDGLLLYYSFDSDSGNTVKGAGTKAVDATATNVTFAAGKVGNAAVFSGDKSSILSNGITDGITGNMSISYWVNMKDVPTKDGTPYSVICSKAWEIGSLHSHINNGKIAFAVNGAVDANPASREKGYEIEVDWRGMETLKDQWVYVAYTYDATTKVRNLYVNTTLVDTSTLKTMPDKVLKGAFEIGSWVTDAKRFMKGSIDEVKIYNRVLSVDEIKTAALDATPVPVPTAKPSPTAAPTAAPKTSAPAAATTKAATSAATTAAAVTTPAPEGLGPVAITFIVIGAIVVLGGAALLIFKKKK